MEVYLLSILFVSTGYSFNVDTENIVNFKGENGTLFGYSAVLLNNDEGHWVLVGAPKANITDKPHLISPGDVFKCRMNFTDRIQEKCESLELPTGGKPYRYTNSPGFEEDNQLLGASMANVGDTIVACAPLWKNYLTGYLFPYAIGRCHNTDSTLRTTRTGVFTTTGFGRREVNEHFGATAGISISRKNAQMSGLFDMDHEPILLGAPDLTLQKGGFILYGYKEHSFNFSSYSTSKFDSDFQRAISAGSLIGYSITTGSIATVHHCPNVVVVGAPKFFTEDGKLGAVLLLCLHKGYGIEIKKQVFGKKNGSGFGTAIVFDDINGDGFNDLIVGAPYQYVDYIDTGAVYIFHGNNTNDILVESRQVLHGEKKKSAMFGMALECMGDMNNDGYNDLVIGAPYQDNGRGAIYIYHGGIPFLILTQRILAKDVDHNLLSFGWYISTPLDIDRNNYPDFAVGSYKTDMVSVFRTRPIIDLSCTVNVYPMLIPLNSSGLNCQDEQYRPCAEVDICFRYSGVGVPDKILVKYTIEADTLRTRSPEAKTSRVSIYVDKQNHNSIYKENSVIVFENETSCRTITVRADITRQFLTSMNETLKFETTFGLNDQPVPGKLMPMLGKKLKRQITKANFSTGCNGTCYPDLKLNVQSTPDEIIFGSTTELSVHIEVTNDGEASHATRIQIVTTNNTSYLDYYQPQGLNSVLGTCQEHFGLDNMSVVNCDLRKSLFQQQRGLFILQFNVSQQMLTDDESEHYDVRRNVVFDIRVFSSGSEVGGSDVLVDMSTPVKFSSKLELLGISRPEQQRLTDEADFVLTHSYDLYNSGPSPMEECTIRVCLPAIQGSDVGSITTSEQVTQAEVQIFHNGYLDSNRNSERTTSSKQPITTTHQPMREAQVDKNTADEAPKFKVLSCENQQDYIIYIMKVHRLDVEDRATIDIPMNVKAQQLDFKGIFVTYFKTSGTVVTIDNDRYQISADNNTFYVTTDIFPAVLSTEAEPISIWVIIGGCLGGLALLIIVGVILWKCGFFKRKKREDVSRWKRQSGYYAARKSQMLEHVPQKSKAVSKTFQY